MFSKKLYALFAIVFLFSWAAFADSLGDVDVSFCETNTGAVMQSGVTVSGSVLFYQTPVEKRWDICYRISNKSPVNATIKISFVDGTFTNDQRRNKACLSDADTKYFGQYVTGFENIITIPANQTIEKKANFIYPTGSDGVYHGCLVYSILENTAQNTGESSNFALLMRRAKFVDVLVGDYLKATENAIVFVDFDPASWENLSSNPKIRYYIDPTDGKYVVQFKLKNVSSVDQNVSITGTVSNYLMYKKTFTEPRIILRDETLLITKKLDEIPSYNLKTKLNISYLPLDTFGNEKPAPGYLSESANIRIFDTVFFVTIIWLLLFLILLLILLKILRNQQKALASKKNQESKE